MDKRKVTPFSAIYDSFWNRVTSDMFLEFTEEDTEKSIQGILINAIPRFEFPRFNIFDYNLGSIEIETDEEDELTGEPVTKTVTGYFNSQLTQEEINILALSMVVEWLGQQLATTENTKLKYSGSD